MDVERLLDFMACSALDHNGHLQVRLPCMHATTNTYTHLYTHRHRCQIHMYATGRESESGRA